VPGVVALTMSAPTAAPAIPTRVVSAQVRRSLPETISRATPENEPAEEDHNDEETGLHGG
jgi:hypothetical protein